MSKPSPRTRLVQRLAFGLALAGGIGLLALSAPESQADDGGWSCYVADRLPNVEEAAEWKGSQRMSEGLNAMASHVPAGEILVLELTVQKGPTFGYSSSSGNPSVICVKR